MSACMRGARILVAEDNMMVAMDLAAELEACDAQVIGPFARIGEALTAAAEGSPDGAILDVNLLDGEVTPLAEKLLADGIPVVFCTGVALPKELRGRYPDSPVFIKPTSPERLAEALSPLLVGAA